MKREPVFMLGKETMEKIAADHGSPLLVVSLDQIEENYKFLKEHLPRVRIYYAMKANPYVRILERMIELGSSFDVASVGEISLLKSLGVDGEKMVYANPIKMPSGFRSCKEAGVFKMTFDNASEVDKIAKEFPGATVLLRMRIENSTAHVDLNKKFGASVEEALPLLLKAKEAGLDMAGIALHVGSQTMQADPYLSALDDATQIFKIAKENNIDLRILDIGGGFPIPEPRVKFNLQEILGQINARLDEDFPNTEIWAEPGRFICGTAVNLITSVIGVTTRNGEPWYFLDDGLYGTFSGVLFDQWDFKIISFKEGEQEKAVFAGPSCDSLDVMFRGKTTVKLDVGDLLLVPSCGAYTSASATTFNGFEKTEMIVWEDIKAKYSEEEISAVS